MTSIGNDTTTILPNMEDKVMAFVLNDSAIKSIIVMTFSCSERSGNGLNFDWRVEVE